MAAPYACLTLSTSTLDLVIAEAAGAGVDPLWLLAALDSEILAGVVDPSGMPS